MAGGYKLWSTGEVVTAANLQQYVQNQTVMVFATTGARDTALSGVLVEGMQCYITGTGGFYYNGSAWVANVTASSTTTFTNKTLTLPIIDNPILGYTTTATAAGTTTLTAASNNQQLFTGTTTQTVVMPVSSTMTLGSRYLIENNSTGIVTVQSSGLNNIIAIPSNTSIKITAILTSGTSAASWDYEFTGFNSITGTGAAVLGTSPTLSTPVISSPKISSTYTAKTAAYTFASGDEGNIFSMNNAATQQFNIPTDATFAFAVGTEINVFWITGAGQPTIGAVTPGTTAVISTAATSATPKLRVANSGATIKKLATDSWIVFGDIA